MPTRTTLALTALLVTASFSVPGCIVSDIHEEMVRTNATLEQLDNRLELIERANAYLDTGNQQLTSLHQRLETMQSIDASLTSIDASLRGLDAHLASLRKTINKIPFVKESPEPESATGAEPTSGAKSNAAAD